MTLRQMTLSLGVASLLLSALLAQAQQPTAPYVLEAGTRARAAGTALEVDVDGTLKLASGGVSRTFRVGSYAAAWVPKTAEVDAIEKTFAARRFADVPGMVDKVYPKLRWVGWGGVLAAMKGKSLLAQGNFTDAEQAFADGLKYEKLSLDVLTDLKTGVVQALIGREKFDEAEKALAGLGSANAKAAPYIYKARGYLREKRGKRKEAVLEYLKIVLLYPDAGAVRREALEKVVALLREDKDIRAEIFAKMLEEG